MKITAVEKTIFTYETFTEKDTDGHTHPSAKPRTVKGGLLTITTDTGHKGHVIASPNDITEGILDQFLRPCLIGFDPMMREKLWQGMYKWQRGSGMRFTDKILAAAELALWDLIGNIVQQPVWKLAGGYRSKILAYGSTMCGDDIKDGLATPEDYGRFAEWLVKTRGYKAVKLHTWMPPVPGAPSVKMDYAACAAVREAVGPDIPLMLDPNHWYSRQDALWLCQRLEELNFLWIEEMMEESSISSYQWLSANLNKLNILGPESAAGKHWTRAEWASKDVCDMIRTGVWDVGGIDCAIKCGHIADGFGMLTEVHGTGAGNMVVCAAIKNTTYYERGLLHPFIDYDKAPAYLNRIDDEMDQDGYVHFPTEPGLGHSINHAYIEANTVKA